LDLGLWAPPAGVVDVAGGSVIVVEEECGFEATELDVGHDEVARSVAFDVQMDMMWR
jgi:hypothetical protein